MKANKVPEKIWMNDDWVHQFDVKCFMGEDSVEYTRTDALIEKACSWLENNLQGIVGGSIYIEDFRKYMEGE